MKEITLKEELFEEPYRFEFFQAVRLLERAFPEKKTVGDGALPHEEVVRFRSRIAMDLWFPLPYSFHSPSRQRYALMTFIGM